MLYKIKYTKTCRDMLARIQEPQRRTILDRIKQLERDPEKQGKPLFGPLRGYLSLHVSRYRVIYRVVREEVRVFVLAAGLRKAGGKDDVYELAKKLVKTFLAP